MGTKTNNYNLIKPAPEDFYNIQDQNGNMDIIDGQLKEMESELEALEKKVDYPTYTTHQTIYNAGSIPSNAVTAPIASCEISGQVVNSLCKNGNFTNVENWSADNATITANSNILQVTTSNEANTGSILQTLSSTYSPTKKVFFRIKAMVTNSNCKAIQIRTKYDGTNYITVAEQTDPVSYKWYTICGIASDIAASGNIVFSVSHVYNDISVATGTVMEIKEAIALDMGENASNELYNLSVEDINKRCPYFVKYGLINTLPQELVMTGVNKFKIDKIILEGMGKKFITLKIKPNTKYTLSMDVNAISDQGRITVQSRNESFYFIMGESYDFSIDNITQGRIVIAIPECYSGNIRIMFYRNSYPNRTGIIEYTNIMLSEGTTALDYVPYEEAVVQIPALNAVSNAIKDTFNAFNGRLTQNVGTKAITDSDITLIKEGTNVSVYGFPLQDGFFNDESDTYILQEYINAGIFSVWDDVVNIGKTFSANSYKVVSIVVAKGTTLAQAQATLAGKVIKYRLNTPKTSYYPAKLLTAVADGLIYSNPRITDIGKYTNKITLEKDLYPIKYLDYVNKIDIDTGVLTSIEVNTCSVATDYLSFIIPGAVEGEYYDYGWYYDQSISTVPIVTFSCATNLKSTVIEAIKGLEEVSNRVDNVSKELEVSSSEINDLSKVINSQYVDYVRQPGYGVTTGRSNTYTITLSPVPIAYVDGMGVTVKINAANMGASTLNVNGLGAKAIVDSKGNALTAGTLRLNGVYDLRYDGTNFVMLGEVIEGSGSKLDADLLDGKEATAFATAAQGIKADNALPATSYTASDVLTKLKTVDGSSSGLDADLLDGKEATAFATAAQGVKADAAATQTSFNAHSSDITKHKQVNNISQTGLYANAEGASTIASGECSHAEGYCTKAVGDYSHAEGYYTNAYGQCSYAEGRFSLSCGGEAYKITAFDNTLKTITLGNISGLSVGDLLSIKVSYNLVKDNIKVLSINGLVVKLDTTYEINSAWKYAINKSQYTYCSHAEGENTLASGSVSHAEGKNTVATGEISHAEGMDTVAAGGYCHAEGYSTIAQVYCDHAEGGFTKACGQYSHAEGCVTNAIGVASHAEGEYTTAIGEGSHSEGQYTLACLGTLYTITGFNDTNKSITLDNISGLSVGNSIDIKVQNNFTIHNIKISAINELTVTLDTTDTITAYWTYAIRLISSNFSSHTEGANTIACGGCSHAEGLNTIASGYYSHAEGVGTNAAGSFSHAEGVDTQAIGARSHAECAGTSATGENSHAEGRITIASGYSSHAEGEQTTASGYYSHSEGCNTTAVGSYSHSEGYATTASAMASHAEGLYTIANNAGSHAMGQYNKNLLGNSTSYSSTSDAFVIGNGTSDTARSNAFRVTFDGKTYGLSAFNSTGADYAEFFEWADGNIDNEDRVGYFVTLDGNKIRKAISTDDYILGVVSVNPSVIGDNHADDWSGKYVTDEWGRIQCHNVVVPATYRTVHHAAVYEENTDKIITDAYDEEVLVSDERTDYVPKLNPDWDSSQEYISREKRKEWSAVGMMGKLLVREDGTCQVNGFCRPNDAGIATTATNGYRVMKRVSEEIVQILVK